MNCRNCGAAMDLHAARHYFFCAHCGSFAFPDSASDDGVKVLQLDADTSCPVCDKPLAAAVIDDRIDAMRGLWGEGDDRYGRFILTAAAAAGIPASADRGDRTDDLVGSMMSAGYDRFAARWGGVADGLDGGL